MIVTQTERKKVGGQSGLEAWLCLNRIKLSELLLIWPSDTHFTLSFQLPLKTVLTSTVLRADGKHIPQKIGAKRKKKKNQQ